MLALEMLNMSSDDIESDGDRPAADIPEGKPVSDNTPPSEGDKNFGITVITLPQVSNCHVFYRGELNGRKRYDVIMTQMIHSYERYSALTSLLEFADETTDIFIYISSPGGDVPVGCSIAADIIRSKAHVVTVAVGGVASIATTIWAAGHELAMTDDAYIMVHMSSHTLGGNSDFVDFNTASVINYVKNTVLKYLIDKNLVSPEESELVFNKGRDVYIGYQTMKDRGVKLMSKQGILS